MRECGGLASGMMRYMGAGPGGPPGTDIGLLTRRWMTLWPDCRPIGHELRACAPGRWVRFHSLPGSKRYAQSEAEYGELLRRHHAVLADLCAGAGALAADELLVMSTAWSGSEEPAGRDPGLAALLPGAVYWTTVQREPDSDGFGYWTHVYVSSAPWRSGELSPLLRYVADDHTQDVILAGQDLSWLYHPYDGGADVITASARQRDILRERYPQWMSAHPTGL
jgi:hypothetical protein